MKRSQLAAMWMKRQGTYDYARTRGWSGGKNLEMSPRGISAHYRAMDRVAIKEGMLKLKHGSDPDWYFDADQLKKGIKVETEHTNDLSIAKQIAKAHLAEDAKYYTKLDRMEKGYCYSKMTDARALMRASIFLDRVEGQLPPPSWKPSKFVATYVDGERSWRQEFDKKPPRPRVSAWVSIKPKS